MKKIIGINLISFRDTKAVGTLIFAKRLFTVLNSYHEIENIKFIFYIQEHINIDDFNIMSNCEVQIVKVPSLKSAAKRIIFEQTFFYLYIKKCDIMFSPSLSLPLFGRYKKILTIHDMVTFVIKDKYTKLEHFVINLMTKLYSKKADLIITVSQNSKNDICKYTSTPPDKVKIIYNFIGNNETILKRNNFDINIKIDAPYFLTVTTLQPAKNIERLIKAFVLFSKNNTKYKLYIVGNKGWRYENLFKLVEDNLMTEKIIFTGYLEDEQLAYMYENCEAVVYMSLFEGFGIPPLEGFYHNKVCLASNNSSIPEVVGKAGILKNPLVVEEIADGFSEILTNKDNLRKYIPEQVEKFNPLKQADNFIRIINNI